MSNEEDNRGTLSISFIFILLIFIIILLYVVLIYFPRSILFNNTCESLGYDDYTDSKKIAYFNYEQGYLYLLECDGIIQNDSYLIYWQSGSICDDEPDKWGDYDCHFEDKLNIRNMGNQR